MSADGGAAFPFVRPVVPEKTVYASSIVVSDGMTLRDYFAANAMQGLMGRAWQDPATGNAPDNVFDLWAKAAYATADAMLAAREVTA